ncbi:V-type ATP synthase subunit I [Thermodesulfobacteriota bacterium]
MKRLQELACLHVVDFKETVLAKDHEDMVSQSDFINPEVEKKINDLNFAIRCLQPFEKKTGILNMLVGKKVLLTKREYEDIVKDFDESDIVKEVRALESEEHALLTEITNNEAIISELAPWKSLNVKVEELTDTKTTCIRLGKLPANKVNNLRDTLDKITNLYELNEINSSSESTYILISFMNEFEDTIEDALTMENFERKDFLKQSGKISDIIASCVAKDKKADDRLKAIGAALQEYSKHLSKLKVMFDHTLNQYGKLRVEQNFGKTDNVNLLEGYIDSADLSTLKDSIEGEFKFAQVEEVELGKDETVPTKLKNKGVTQSFEVVLDLYGMPSSKSFDSTSYLMPFFAVFFGFCLTDGGYGILLALFSIFMIKKYKPIFGKSKLMWVLFVSGITTIFVGAITGGWFGDIVDLMPASMDGLKGLKDSVKLFDPIKQPMVFFMLSLALGFIHIMFGLVIGLIKHIKDGELKEALCTKFTWIMFLMSILFWVFAMQGIFMAGAAGFFKTLFIASAVAIVLFSETGASSIGIKIASGLYNLYGATSYFGDLLSYLRLLALGLASGVIAVIVNKMAGLTMDIPVVGFIIAAIVFVGGHVFNLVLSGLGAFVHTLRLNYVEFFPKFFVGGGKIFTPFEMESSYLIFDEEKKEESKK